MINHPIHVEPSAELSDREMTSLEKIAVLRGKCGRLRRAIRDALDQLPEGTPARSILEQALEERS